VRTRAPVVPVGRKVLPEAVHNPLFADRSLRARDFLAVHRSLALAAVETALEGHLLEHTQKVTVRPSFVAENQGTRAGFGACVNLGQERIRDRDVAFLAILRLESEVRLLIDSDGLGVTVYICDLSHRNLGLAKAGAEEKPPQELFVLVGHAEEVFEFLAGVRLRRCFDVLHRDAHVLDRRAEPATFIIAKER
jgi:hypothetical protein